MLLMCICKQTVNGWVSERLDAIPAVGQCFLEGDYRISVTKTALRRVEEIRIELAEPAGEGTV